MKVPEVCNANMTSLPIDIVHSLVKSQTSFQAGKLKHFLPQWEAITADPTILQIVTGVKIEFKSSVAPQLSPPALAELQCWRDNAQTLKRDIQHAHPSTSIQSDASTLGWGAVFGTQKTGGRWTPSEAEYHINIFELLAAFFSLKCFCSHMNNCHIQIQIDNTTALAYINNMGGSKSKELNQLAVEIWEWCIS